MSQCSILQGAEYHIHLDPGLNGDEKAAAVLSDFCIEYNFEGIRKTVLRRITAIMV